MADAELPSDAPAGAVSLDRYGNLLVDGVRVIDGNERLALPPDDDGRATFTPIGRFREPLRRRASRRPVGRGFAALLVAAFASSAFAYHAARYPSGAFAWIGNIVAVGVSVFLC